MTEDLPIACGTAMPIGWTLVNFEDICGSGQYGWTSSASSEGTVKYLRTTDITKGKISWDSVPYCKETPADIEKYRVQKNDILISRAGSIGFSSLIDEIPTLTIFASYLIRFVPSEEVKPTYIAYFLKSPDYWRQIADFSSGIALANINAKKISKIKVPLPPLNEQRRIVEKLDRIFDRLRRVRDELSHIKKLIDRYRQSVLKAAFRGDLTADWRRKNINLVSGSELLEKIKEKQIKNLGSKTKTLFTCGYFDNPIEADFLPDSWTFCQIGNIGTVCNGSTPSRKIPEYWNGCISWVSSGEVRNNIIVATKESITQEGFDNSSVRILPPGTVLLAMIGEGKTRGQTAILKIQATINQNIAAIIIDHGLIVSEYLWYWFQSQYQTTREAGNGSGPQALNCQRVRELLFILPPLEEQKEIVRRVEERFARIDKLEQEYQKAVKLCDRLEQATLAKAFRGELVPQDPNDEPASVLLERIRSEKKTLTQPKGKGRRQK